MILTTTKKMTAREAPLLYKSRDEHEKLFRVDKLFLGNRSLKVHSKESPEARIFIEFITLIIKNRIYTCLKEKYDKEDRRYSYMLVPAAMAGITKKTGINDNIHAAQDKVFRMKEGQI